MHHTQGCPAFLSLALSITLGLCSAHAASQANIGVEVSIENQALSERLDINRTSSATIEKLNEELPLWQFGAVNHGHGLIKLTIKAPGTDPNVTNREVRILVTVFLPQGGNRLVGNKQHTLFLPGRIKQFWDNRESLQNEFTAEIKMKLGLLHDALATIMKEIPVAMGVHKSLNDDRAELPIPCNRMAQSRFELHCIDGAKRALFVSNGMGEVSSFIQVEHAEYRTSSSGVANPAASFPGKVSEMVGKCVRIFLVQSDYNTFCLNLATAGETGGL